MYLSFTRNTRGRMPPSIGSNTIFCLDLIPSIYSLNSISGRTPRFRSQKTNAQISTNKLHPLPPNSALKSYKTPWSHPGPHERRCSRWPNEKAPPLSLTNVTSWDQARCAKKFHCLDEFPAKTDDSKCLLKRFTHPVIMGQSCPVSHTHNRLRHWSDDPLSVSL